MLESYGRPVFTTFDSGTYQNRANVADGGTAIAHKFGNAQALSTSGAIILAGYSDDFVTQKFYFDKDGNVQADGSLILDGAGVYIGSIADASILLVRKSTSKLLGGTNAGYICGNYVTAYGDESGKTATIGSSAFGYYSGFNQGEYNASIGYWAGYNAASGGGDNSLFAGAYSGYGNRGSGQVCLGYKSGYGVRAANELSIHNDETGPLIGGNFSNNIIRFNGDTYVFSEQSLGAEVLSEGDFATHADWNTSGSCDDTLGYARWTGAGTLTQPSGNFSTALIGNRFYLLVYEILATASAPGMTLTTGIVDTAIDLVDRIVGTHYALIKTKASPGDFVIDCTSGTVNLDNLSLKEIQGGDLWVRGNIDAIGDIQLTGDRGSGTASTNTLTGATDTPTTDPGWATSSSVDMNAPDGYVKMYIGTQAVVVPYWNT